MTAPFTITLPEWKTVSPSEEKRLKGLSFDGTPGAAELAKQLATERRLSIVERRDGLQITTTSFVGSVSIGPLRLIIEPKIEGPVLLRLLRYAYGLRDLQLHAEHDAPIAAQCFQDILLHQLAAEVTELIARGLHRRYRERREALVIPRGRIDFGRLVAEGGVATAELPCRHHVREENCFPNQVLLAGLRLGSTLATDGTLAVRLRQLARRLNDQIERIAIGPAMFARIRREQNHLLAAYEPAFELIKLLAANRGASVTGHENIEIPGFLFDMNRFFERLIGGFLEQHLTDSKVIGQLALRRLFSYETGYNPLGRRAPTPRPDFVVTTKGRPSVVLDAKYRDLWEHSLPREMLYQLAIYTLVEGSDKRAVILYPTTSPGAIEQRIAIRDPVAGKPAGTVVLRPVPIVEMAEMLAESTSARTLETRRRLAHRLAFGSAAKIPTREPATNDFFEV